MNPKYREDKAAQVAALFLKLKGSKMSKIKLTKLLYIAEREALIRWRRPIVFDTYVSMPKGPVLSKTLNIMNGEQSDVSGPWDEAISPPDQSYRVEIKQDPGTDNLSEAEEQLIAEVYNKYGNVNRWDLCDLTHDFPEWVDPQGSSIQISYEDILSAAGKTPIEVASAIEEIEDIARMDQSME